MDFSKLSNGDKVVLGSGILLFISSFLKWFSYQVEVFGVTSPEYTETGWDSFFTGGLPALIGLLLVGYVVVTKLLDGVELPELPIGWPLVVLGAGGLAAVLVVLRLLLGNEKYGVDLDRAYGLFVATVAALGLAAGCFLKFKEDGGELPTKGGGTSGGDGGAATPF